MPGAEQWVVDDLGDARVNLAARLAEVPVEDRRQQRMGEADRAVVALDHVRLERRHERCRRHARTLGAVLSGVVPNADASASASRVGPGSPEICSRRSSSSVSGSGSDGFVPRSSQREERIPARLLVDPEQGLACELSAETIAQEAMERADAERTDREPADALRVERLLELRRR